MPILSTNHNALMNWQKIISVQYPKIKNYNTIKFGKITNYKAKNLKKSHQIRILNCSESQAISSTNDDSSKEIGSIKWKTETLIKMILFAIPALAIPLADPLLSLVDTWSVARFSNRIDLAALAPNVAVFNFVNYPFTSLGVATISLVARYLANEDGDNANICFSIALFIALFSGIIITISILIFSRHIVTSSGASAEIIKPAINYMKIRALAQPAVLGTIVCQACIIAQKDSKTVFYTVSSACLLNIIGDIFFLRNLKMGVIGVSIATTMAEIFEFFVMSYVIYHKKTLKLVFSIIKLSDVKKVLFQWFPLSFVYITKNLSYLAISWSAASLNVLKLASHQITYSWWQFCAFTNGSIESTALAFISSSKMIKEEKELIMLVLGMGTGFGLFIGCLASSLIFMAPYIFTPDNMIWPLMKKTTPYILISLIALGVDVACTSVIYARQDANYLTLPMASTLCIIFVYFVFWKKFVWDYFGVWRGLVLFFIMRMSWSAFRVLTHHLNIKS